MEIMIVIMILGIISMLAVPNLLQANERWMLRSTAHMISNDIRRMQSMSIHESDQYQFELHTKSFYYQTKNYQANADIIKRVTLDPRITTITSTLYDPMYAGQREGYRILRFSYLGSPNRAGTITLKTKQGNRIEITIDVTTGRVRVFD